MKKFKIPSKIETDHVVNKSFNYTKNGTNLSFTLRVDTDLQLRNFEALLTLALSDIQAELTVFNKS